MARRSLRYIMTGPGIPEGDEPSYEHAGQALSRSLTFAGVASKGFIDGTWYVRDSLSKGQIVGYSETDTDGRIITRGA